MLALDDVDHKFSDQQHLEFDPSQKRIYDYMSHGRMIVIVIISKGIFGLNVVKMGSIIIFIFKNELYLQQAH